MAPYGNAHFWKSFQPPFPGRTLWPALLCLCLGMVLAAWHLIENAVERQGNELVSNLHSRAEALAWAIEGAARFAAHGKARGSLDSLLEEVGRQPGIAWIAITSQMGMILSDSSPDLAGRSLYTRKEMLLLAPSLKLQGRFSPDEPDTYEVWKKFAPERLRRSSPHHSSREEVLFVALDASAIRTTLAGYEKRLWLVAAALIATIAAIACLGVYIHGYRVSRRGLKDAIAFAQQIIDGYQDGLFVISPDGWLTLYNHKIRSLFRLEAFAELNLADLGGYDWANVLKELDGNRTIRERKGELAWPGRPSIPFDLSAAPITSAAGQKLGYLVVIHDLAEVAQLKSKLAEARRLGVLSNIASGLAHEIRNPLSSIRGYACYLASRLENDLMARRSADLLVEEADRLNRVLDDLLHIARPRLIRPAPLDLVRVIGKALAIIKPDAEAKHIHLHFQSPPTAPAVLDANALLQAILNILLNAVQILSRDGEVSMTLEELDPRSPDMPLELSGQGAWRIEIRDNGPGMPASVMEEIFTPYFTTRPDGTGLGLPIARQIIRAHGGVLAVASVPGQSTSFTIFLPMHADARTYENTDR